MNILNLPGWEVTGHTQTKTDYRIEAVYTPEPTACPECSTLFDRREALLLQVSAFVGLGKEGIAQIPSFFPSNFSVGNSHKHTLLSPLLRCYINVARSGA